MGKCLCETTLTFFSNIYFISPFRLVQDIRNSGPPICEHNVRSKELKLNWGQSVHMSCPIHSPDIEILLSTYGSLKWYYYRNERSSGYEVTRRDKFYYTSDQGLVILGVTDRENGRYDCRLGNSILSSYNVSVDASELNQTTYQKGFLFKWSIFSRNLHFTF